MFFGLDRLGKNTISTSFHAGLGALNGFFQTFLGEGIGARHDKKAFISTRVCRRFNPVNHFVFRHYGFIRAVTTAFLRHLIFNMHRCCAGFDHVFNGFGNVKCPAPTGVDVHQQGQVTGTGNAVYINQHIV